MLSAMVTQAWTGSVVGGGVADDGGRSARSWSSDGGLSGWGFAWASTCVCFGAGF